MSGIEALDQALFLLINSWHTPWLDQVMYWISGKYSWMPLYLVLLGLTVKTYKKQAVPVLVCLTLAIVIADQTTSGFMKPFFERLRPSRDPALQGLVHIVNGYTGGKYGFASSHAANTFAVATFFIVLFNHKNRWALGLLVWATVVSYSRIYLGVHYPGDVVVGALVGALGSILAVSVILPTAESWYSKVVLKTKNADE